ncbi:MAG: ROK family protein [Elusimicrobia bacterium]|nr:ROK family protein [Elusimicrobiota bacterium]
MKLAIGVDIGGTNTGVSVVNGQGKVFEQFSIETPKRKSAKDVLIKIFSSIYSRKELRKIRTVGRGVPAVIHPGTGYVDFAPNLGWKNFQMRRVILSRFDIKKIVFENDGNCAAWGIFKRIKNLKSLCVITLGTGIGGGLILNKRLVSTPEFSAFEIGHMKISSGGQLCGCGSRGCIETFCGAKYFRKWAKKYYEHTEHGGDDLTPLEIDTFARNGEKWAIKAWEKYGEYLAVAVANIINLFVPERIIFTGGIASGFSLFEQSLLQTVDKLTFPSYRGRVKIGSVAWNYYIGSIGAGLLALT